MNSIPHDLYSTIQHDSLSLDVMRQNAEATLASITGSAYSPVSHTTTHLILPGTREVPTQGSAATIPATAHTEPLSGVLIAGSAGSAGPRHTPALPPGHVTHAACVHERGANATVWLQASSAAPVQASAAWLCSDAGNAAAHVSVVYATGGES